MNKWDKQEDKDDEDEFEKKLPRYKIDLMKEGIRLIDLYTGNVRFGSWDGKQFGGMGKASDFQGLSDSIRRDKRTLEAMEKEFFKMNFNLKDICKDQGIDYL